MSREDVLAKAAIAARDALSTIASMTAEGVHPSRLGERLLTMHRIARDANRELKAALEVGS